MIVYDKSIEDFLTNCVTHRGGRRLGRGAMTFPDKPVGAGIFNVGDVVETHLDDNVLFRKHSSGSFTVLVDSKPEPAFQHFMRFRDAMGLPDKPNNTTRSLGAQVFAKLRSESA